MLSLQDVAYMHPNGDLLFANLNLIINKGDKIALVGNNGSGKSTILKILNGDLIPFKGAVKADPKPYYIPQVFGQFNNHSLAEVLHIEDKLKALGEILDGNVTDENLVLLDDDWAIEERCREAFAYWELADLDLTQKMGTLSGGQKTKVFLAGMLVHHPEIILMDEPTNHLDLRGRFLLDDYIKSTKNTLLVVSHDRTLLNLLDAICELSTLGINMYGGNYDVYAAQKAIETNALNQELKSKEKALRKAKEIEKANLERQNKLDARGKKKQEKAGLPTISMNTLRNSAERSTSRMKDIHAEKVNGISGELSRLRNLLPDVNRMKIDIDNSMLHKGKVLVAAKDINFGYHEHLLWKQALTFQIISGERIAIKGINGSGKTTLIRIILAELQPLLGTVSAGGARIVYVDQDYSLIDNTLTVYEQAQRYNEGLLAEHEIKSRLDRFLFEKESWDTPCAALSGGEKMRLILCCLTVSTQAPDIIILDEPTNNLDIQNLEILTAAINQYKGTLLVVSHDEFFLRQVGIGRIIAVE